MASNHFIPFQIHAQMQKWNRLAHSGNAATFPGTGKINRGLTSYPHGPDCQPYSASSLVLTNGNT